MTCVIIRLVQGTIKILYKQSYSIWDSWESRSRDTRNIPVSYGVSMTPVNLSTYLSLSFRVWLQYKMLQSEINFSYLKKQLVRLVSEKCKYSSCFRVGEATLHTFYLVPQRYSQKGLRNVNSFQLRLRRQHSENPSSKQLAHPQDFS